MIMSASTHAAVYKCVKDGQISYSNDRCANADIVATGSDEARTEEVKCSATRVGLPSSKKKNDEAELHVIGIYEGPIHRGSNPLANKVNVHVLNTGHPIILVLHSYESVVWDLSIDKGSVLQEVILGAHEKSPVPELLGIDEKTVKVTRRSFYPAYNSCMFYGEVAPALQEFSGHDVQSFQGAYRGLEFTIQTRNKGNKQIIASAENGNTYEKSGIATEKSQLSRLSLIDKGKIGEPFKSGLEEFRNEHYAEAARLFKKAVAQEPKASAPWYFLGESLAKTGNTDEALCAYSRVLDLHQNDPSASQAQTDLAIAGIRKLSEKYSPSAPLNCNQILSNIIPASGNDSKSLQDKLKSCDPKVAISAAEAILGKPDSLNEPLELFSPAAVLFQQGRKDDAVFWFYAAQLRVRHQLVFEKGDRGQLLTVMMMTVGVPINNYAFQDVSNLNRILDRVLEWDRRTTNSLRDKPRTKEMDQQIEQIYAGFRNLKAKLVAEKTDLESKARSTAPMIEQAYNQQAKSLCGKGEIDPSDANQIIEKEWGLVMDFVKHNPDVIRAVGAIQGVGRESSTMKPGEIVPSRYIASVGGDSSTYAVIDVSRISGNAKFSLACLTHLSLGQRDPFKDVCKQ